MILLKTQLILKRYGFSAKKKYGQNFLVDEDILEEIASNADITKDDIVLEIGPGIGSLTQYLAERAKKVVAVEIDKSLIPIIGDFLGPCHNVDLINADIMKFDIDAYFDALIESKSKTGTGKHAEDGYQHGCGAVGVADEDTDIKNRFMVIANLPYYITTPVIMKLIEGRTTFDKMLFMVQREVAERMVAGPGSKDYGALSLAVNYYAKTSVIGTVPPECFFPRPKVESALILLDKYREPPVKVRNEELMFKLIRASFNQRRKTLANGIANFEGLDIPKDKVISAIKKCGFDENVRGEKLSIGDFATLSDELCGGI